MEYTNWHLAVKCDSQLYQDVPVRVNTFSLPRWNCNGECKFYPSKDLPAIITAIVSKRREIFKPEGGVHLGLKELQKACFKSIVMLQKYCVSFFPNLYKQFRVVQGVPGRPGHPGPAGAKGEKVFPLFIHGKDLWRFCNPITQCFGSFFKQVQECNKNVAYISNFYLCFTTSTFPKQCCAYFVLMFWSAVLVVYLSCREFSLGITHYKSFRKVKIFFWHRYD